MIPKKVKKCETCAYCEEYKGTLVCWLQSSIENILFIEDSVVCEEYEERKEE